MASTDTSALGRLRGLLEITRLVRSEDALPDMLAAIARSIAQSLGYATVVAHLYRPAHDDFEAAAVHAAAAGARPPTGTVSPRAGWEALLHERDLRDGVYVIPPASGNASAADQPALVVQLRRSDGALQGLVTVADLASATPTDDELEVLAAMAEHAALAIEAAQDAASAERHRAALEQLLSVSAQLTESFSIDSILLSVCAGIQSALAFRTVWVELPDPADGLFRPRASAGDSGPTGATTRDDVAAQLERRFEVEGCYLIDPQPPRPSVVRTESLTVGGGPRPWGSRRLLVPLWSRLGGLIGVIRVDDPEDQLVPSRLLLQALRVFANQATTALDSAAQYEEMQFLAEHDPLTRLYNRRAFNQRLAVETARAMRYAHPLALVLADLDDFKALNDTHGHVSGDASLERVGRVMAEALRRPDAAFRIGGDEFALILPETTAQEAAAVVARISAALAADPDGQGPLSVTFGIAMCPHDGSQPHDLYRAGDAALYAAKQQPPDAA